MKKRMLFIYNPMAGQEQIKNKLSDIIQIFCRNNFEVTIFATQGKEDATKILLKKAHKYDYIVCSGGDGTINEVATGMMQLEQRPICGYIPAGTVNDFATSLRIPKTMQKAAAMITEEEVFLCDIGGFNDRYFTYVAGFGAFTEVSYQTPQEWKNAIGKMAYFVEGVKHIADIKPHHMKLQYGDQVIEDDFILGLVSNSFSVGGYKAYNRKTIRLDDGLLEGLFVRNPKNPIEWQQIINAMVSKKYDEAEAVLHFQCAKIIIESDDEIQWTLDGEDGGFWNKVEIQDFEKALPILCPVKSHYRIEKKEN